MRREFVIQAAKKEGRKETDTGVTVGSRYK